MPVILKNNAFGFLQSAISNSDTSIVLQSGYGANFPTLGAGDYFYMTISPTSGASEIVKVTARSGDSLNIVRAQEGTFALGFPAGSRVELRVTAQSVVDAIADRVAQKDQASEISFVPYANIGATNVQAAIQEEVDDLAAATGSSLVGFQQAGVSAVTRTAQAKMREIISVKDFGAVGDSNGASGNGTDDYAAIQAALNYVGSTGGGTVTLAKTNGQYRITQGLKIPSYTTLQGVAPDRYPFNSGNANNSCLFADFVVQNQWIIDTSATKVATGLPYAYNELCNNVAPNFAFNSGVRDLLVRAAGVMPWGGIRIQGCPGAVVDNVSVTGCGTGMLVNFTFGGYFSIHCLTPYYGVIAWDNVNANNWEVYCAATQPVAQIVPAGYLQPMMAALNGAMVPVLKLNTNAHYNRSWGMIIGSDGLSTSTNNSLDLTVERYSGGLFQYYSYGTVFNKFYFEGSGTPEMNYACVSAYSLWVTNTFHAYLSSPSCYFLDLGIYNQIRLTAIGLKNGSYGFGPFPDISSLVTIDGISPYDFGPAVPQFNMYYTGGNIRTTVTSFQNSWVNVGSPYDVVQYVMKKQINEVNLTGAVTGGSAGTVAFNLPAGYRPLYRVKNIVPGGEVQIDTNGNVTMVSGTTLYLEQVRFTASP
jgi:hypothetical protein